VKPVRDFDTITPDLAIWHAYDAEVKAELYSTRLVTAGGVYLIDPIPLQKRALEALIGSVPVAGIIVTNSYHHRAAAGFAEQLSIPIFAHRDTFTDQRPFALNMVADGEEICENLCNIAIDGGPPGEIVLRYAANGGTLIVGDALIHFEPYGFTLLPAKYCSDQKQMHRSLRKLLDHKVERIFFAHGMPIVSGATERLQILLNSSL
jgi:glyoxylase-like metal-dependent hydrolase (beta-lactamase superfamily II)